MSSAWDCSRALHRAGIGGLGLAEFEGLGLAGFLGRPTVLFAFEQRHNRHRVAMSEPKVGLEPGHDGTRLHALLLEVGLK